MGLDWCLEEKTKPGHEEKLEQIESQMVKTNQAYKTESEFHHKFDYSIRGRALIERKKLLYKERKEHVIEPAETLQDILSRDAHPQSFRGKRILYICWLDSELRKEAYSEFSPEKLVKYGESLLAAAKKHESTVTMPTLATGATLSGVNAVTEAGNWCKFWGSHGHGMWPWY